MTRARPEPLPEWSDAETAWFAGLFEGEGCVRLAGRRVNGRGTSPEISVLMTDEDVIARAARMLGRPYRPQRRASDRHKQAWRVDASSRALVTEVGRRIAPWLGVRRKAQFEAALA